MAELTDEQIDAYARRLRELNAVGRFTPDLQPVNGAEFDAWLAAVEGRAKREERERIARALARRAAESSGLEGMSARGVPDFTPNGLLQIAFLIRDGELSHA